MRIAVSTVCWRHRSLAEAVQLASQAGFTALEAVLFPREIGQMHGDLRELRPAELMRLLGDHGLALAAIHTGGILTAPPERCRATTDYTRLAIAAAAETGCNLVVLGGPRRAAEPFLPFIRALEELVPILERTPVRLALENHYAYWLQYPQDYEHLFDAIASPQVGMTLDSGHFYSAGVDPVSIARQFGERIFHVHIKDRIGLQAVPFGTGEIDNLGTVRALAAAGYQGYLSQELEMGHSAADESAAAACNRYMRMLLAAAVD
ncbi:MAG: sugar phosphate isomerase/epimerase family protein [Anaerolineae bacterium]